MKPAYQVDKNNHFKIIRGREILRPKGKFSVNSDNQLAYLVSESENWRKQHALPKRISLKGKWAVDSSCNVIFILQKTPLQTGGEKLVLKTRFIQAKAKSLLFSITSRGKSGTQIVRILELKGNWQADQYNRLQFLVKRARASSEALTFQGAWEVKNNSLRYTYKKTSLKTKLKQTHSLYFKGYWQINQRNRLTYIVDTKNNSGFDFRVYLETPNLIGKKGTIKYRAGIGLKGSTMFKAQTISLYGVWKLQRKAGLSFVVDYADQRTKAIKFKAFLRKNKKTKISLGLKSTAGKDLGISLEFTKSFLKNNAEWFFKLIQEEKYPGFKCGVNIWF